MPAQPKPFDWSQAHPWARAAFQFGQQNQSWFAVKANSPEHDRWAAYFHALGWAPLMFRVLDKASKDGNERCWTAPCQWPEWLTVEIDVPRLQQQTARALAGQEGA